jgi:hypothetical protein
MVASSNRTISIRLSIDFVQDELGMWSWIESQDGGSQSCSREAYSNLNDCVKNARHHLAFARLRIDLPMMVPPRHDGHGR